MWHSIFIYILYDCAGTEGTITSVFVWSDFKGPTYKIECWLVEKETLQIQTSKNCSPPFSVISSWLSHTLILTTISNLNLLSREALWRFRSSSLPQTSHKHSTSMYPVFWLCCVLYGGMNGEKSQNKQQNHYRSSLSLSLSSSPLFLSPILSVAPIHRW